VEQLGCHEKDCHEILHLMIFRNSGDKIHVSLKSDKNKGYFTLRPIYVFDHVSLSSSANEKYFRQICRDNQNTFFFENPAVYEIMWK
jgi:hypothetical protein